MAPREVLSSSWFNDNLSKNSVGGKMRNVIVVVVLAVISIGLISCNKKAESEPYSFKEFQLDMTLEDFDNLMVQACNLGLF